MKILVDMNLSPRWVAALQEVGIEARHWSAVGATDAPDEDVLSWTAANGFVLLTHDLDFGAILAFSRARIPSVIQIRTEDVRPDVLVGRGKGRDYRDCVTVGGGCRKGRVHGIPTRGSVADHNRVLPLNAVHAHGLSCVCGPGSGLENRKNDFRFSRYCHRVIGHAEPT